MLSADATLRDGCALPREHPRKKGNRTRAWRASGRAMLWRVPGVVGVPAAVARRLTPRRTRVRSLRKLITQDRRKVLPLRRSGRS